MTGIAAQFTGPEYYDKLIGRIFFAPFAAALAQRLPPHPPGDLLEIACGTGLVTEKLRERLDPTLKLTATDLSAPMLGYAKEKLKDRAGIDWREADALALPFPDAAFGAVACGFGIMFVTDRAAMLREARRVLVPGGTLLLSVWGRIEDNPHAMTNAEVVESFFPGDPEMRFRTPYGMHDPALLRRLLAETGFRDVQIETKRVSIACDPLDLATGQIRGTPRSALIEKKGLPLQAVIDKVAQALAQAGGDPYRGHAQGHIASARAA